MTNRASPGERSRWTKRLTIAVWLALSCFFLTSCFSQKVQEALMHALVPHDDDVLAQHFIEWVRAGNYDEARLHLDPSLQGEKLDQSLLGFHALLAKGEMVEIKLIGCNITLNGTKHSSDLSYEIHFPDYWVAGDVVIDTQKGLQTVAGFHFHQIATSYEEANRFSLHGKSYSHYVVLAFCLGTPLFILYALVVCVRTQIRRKWLWIIFILFGLMRIDFNWTTGESDMKPLSIVLFGSGFYTAGPYAPLLLNFGFPVGALVFLSRRKTPNQPD